MPSYSSSKKCFNFGKLIRINSKLDFKTQVIIELRDNNSREKTAFPVMPVYLLDFRRVMIKYEPVGHCMGLKN